MTHDGGSSGYNAVPSTTCTAPYAEMLQSTIYTLVDVALAMLLQILQQHKQLSHALHANDFATVHVQCQWLGCKLD